MEVRHLLCVVKRRWIQIVHDEKISAHRDIAVMWRGHHHREGEKSVSSRSFGWRQAMSNTGQIWKVWGGKIRQHVQTHYTLPPPLYREEYSSSQDESQSARMIWPEKDEIDPGRIAETDHSTVSSPPAGCNHNLSQYRFSCEYQNLSQESTELFFRYVSELTQNERKNLLRGKISLHRKIAFECRPITVFYPLNLNVCSFFIYRKHIMPRANDSLSCGSRHTRKCWRIRTWTRIKEQPVSGSTA